MQSEIKNERFTLIAEKKCFRDILNAMADALGVKRPEIHAKPFDGNTLEIGLVCFECFSTKENYQTNCQSSMEINFIPIKRLKTL
jgi:hypothetical protein